MDSSEDESSPHRESNRSYKPKAYSKYENNARHMEHIKDEERNRVGKKGHYVSEKQTSSSLSSSSDSESGPKLPKAYGGDQPRTVKKKKKRTSQDRSKPNSRSGSDKKRESSSIRKNGGRKKQHSKNSVTRLPDSSRFTEKRKRSHSKSRSRSRSKDKAVKAKRNSSKSPKRDDKLRKKDVEMKRTRSPSNYVKGHGLDESNAKHDRDHRSHKHRSSSSVDNSSGTKRYEKSRKEIIPFKNRSESRDSRETVKVSERTSNKSKTLEVRKSRSRSSSRSKTKEKDQRKRKDLSSDSDRSSCEGKKKKAKRGEVSDSDSVGSVVKKRKKTDGLENDISVDRKKSVKKKEKRKGEKKKKKDKVKSKKSHKDKKKKKKKNKKEKEEKYEFKDKSKVTTSLTSVQEKLLAIAGVDVEKSRKEKTRNMKPMTKEEYEKHQSETRYVYDPDTGRNRLVRGSGEIIEEIVSRDRHKAINKQATKGDGQSFQRQLGLLK